MSYDRWKTTNPDDEWLGPEPVEGEVEEEMNGEEDQRFNEARAMLGALLHMPADVVVGIETLRPHERVFLIATCSAVMIEYAICETSNYDVRRALQGLDALVADMREEIAKRCKETDAA